MKRTLIAVLVVVLATAGLFMVAQAQNKGASDIVLNGGKSGNVPFPHHRHQEVVADCNACHELFPQQSGVIDELKATKKLQKKTVMNNCQKCHRKTKKAGMKSGPIGCKKCHSIKV
jgi:hypothetical protein